jgi:F-type H+-transporting ATPase subunit epsilon
MALNLDIVTPQKQVFSGEAREVRAPGWLGEFGVMPGHANLLSIVRAGVITIAASEGERRFVVGRGFAEAGPERVVILTEVCEAAEDVDRDAAAADLSEAESELASLEPLTEAYRQVEAKIELAQARLSV